ncbi:hypothetical protein DL98DRAFT_579347 [Cadophora sp. DSE1049]|nr:hypothetical protein DL98DRAFT_579347 [Cadophora sp. DSE1049]
MASAAFANVGTPNTSHFRDSSAVALLHTRSPYTNFYSGPPSHSHPEPGREVETELLQISASPLPPAPGQLSTNSSASHTHLPRSEPTWLSKGGHGSRHTLDHFTFSLWDAEQHTYRPIKKDELLSIKHEYAAYNVRYFPPFVIVATSTPPSCLPLTIGCAPALFISPETDDSGWNPLLVDGNTNYVNPRVPDPAPENNRSPWTRPKLEEIRLLWTKLSQFANLKRMNFAYPYLLVELREDGRQYDAKSLPGKVGGWLTTYHHHGEYREKKCLARDRDLAPSSSPEDNTNYLTSRRKLNPGVRVEGNRMATSCGVLIRKGSQIRLTGANHGFLDTEQVWHPNKDGFLIGTIQERYPEEDWSLIMHIRNLPFTNSEYFAAEAPTYLLAGDDCGDGWYEVDGMSTGVVQMMCIGVSASLSEILPEYASVPHQSFRTDEAISNIFQGIGALGSEDLIDGMCGAPIVSVDTGGVAGFFRMAGAGGLCYAPTLDRLIEEGWKMELQVVPGATTTKLNYFLVADEKNVRDRDGTVEQGEMLLGSNLADVANSLLGMQQDLKRSAEPDDGAEELAKKQRSDA